MVELLRCFRSYVAREMKNVMSKYLILKNNGRMYVYKSLSRVAKCRLLIIGIVFCLALSICCDGHVEGLRPKHIVVLYTIGRGVCP